MSVITMKIPYKLEDSSKQEEIFFYIKNYNSIYNQTFNYMLANLKNGKFTPSKEILKFFKNKNNIKLDTWFQNSAHSEVYEALSKLKNADKLDSKIIFGGRKLFIDRCSGKISKDEFKIKKLRQLYSIGQASRYGNLKFRIIGPDTVLFRLGRGQTEFKLKLFSIGKQYKKYIRKLIELQNKQVIPITYKLGLEHIYISFEYSALKIVKKTRKIKNRILSLDLNPNYIGYTIIDWKSSNSFNIIKSGSFSLKSLLDMEKTKNSSSDSVISKYLTNKRHYEIYEIANSLARIAKQYKCQIFSIENLSIVTKDNNRGKSYNRLVNNLWNRRHFISILEKKCQIFGIQFYKVLSQYSSFIGNMLYRKLNLPDYCLASIEISRRAYEFYNQYITKEKSKNKNIVFLEKPKVEDLISQSLEELEVDETWADLKELYYKLKSRKCTCRVSKHDSMIRKEVFNSKALIMHTDYRICNQEFKIL